MVVKKLKLEQVCFISVFVFHYNVDIVKALKLVFQNSFQIISKFSRFFLVDETRTKISMDTNMEKDSNEINRDRFNLVAGICVEAMCSPLSSYPDGTMAACIHSIVSLLQSPYGRSQISSNKVISPDLFLEKQTVRISLQIK